MKRKEDFPMRNLKEKSIARIILDMIKDTMNKGSGEYLILILDDYSSKMLSSFLTMSDLLNIGLFTIESLNKKRKPYPKYHALYLISPTKNSCEKIVEDFSIEKEPMYSRVHIFFTHQIEDRIFDILIEKNLVKRIQTCKELNLSYFIRCVNLFDFGDDFNLRIFSNIFNKSDINNMINKMASKLLTVCCVLNENPNIQYQKKSTLCLQLGEALKSQLKRVYKNREKKGILFITDRTLDPTTPLLHDYTYESIIYDLFKFKHYNELDLSINSDNSKFDDKDEMWMNYKDIHIAEVFNKITEDLQSFKKSDLAKVGKADDLESFEDMENCLKNMTGYKEKNRMFSLHIKLCEEINNLFKDKELNSIIDLEQDILSGVSESGEELNSKEIIKRFTVLKNKLENQNQYEDIERLLGIIYNCLDISEKDFNILCGGSYNNKFNMQIFDNFSSLGVNFADPSSKKGLRREKLSKENIKELKRKLTKIAYKNLRVNPKIENIVEMATKVELSRSEFPFIDPPENLVKAKKYNTGGIFGKNKNDDDDKPAFIYFNIGGISHNEICALNNLNNNNNINYKLIIGSTGIYTAKNYLNELANIHKGTLESEKLITDDTNTKKVEISDIQLIAKKQEEDDDEDFK